MYSEILILAGPTIKNKKSNERLIKNHITAKKIPSLNDFSCFLKYKLVNKTTKNVKETAIIDSKSALSVVCKKKNKTETTKGKSQIKTP